MGEKVAPPADIPFDLPRVNTLREALAHSAPPTPTQMDSGHSTGNHDGLEGQKLLSVVSGLGEAIAAKTYFDQIIENAPEAISIVDLDRKILRINGAFTRLFGFTADEALGKRLDRLIVPPDRYTETAWIGESIKTENKILLETCRQRKDGSLIGVSL